MSHWLTHTIFLSLLWHWSMSQDHPGQICHHVDAKDYKYTVQCYGLNSSNFYQLTMVMNDVRFKFPYDRMRVMVGNSDGDALPDDVFDGYVIQSLELTNCGFTSIPFRLITKLPPYLQGLNLNNNNISSIDFQKLNELPYTATLTHLNLYSNRIESLPEDAFANFSHLLSLKLHDNLLEKLEGNTFRGLKKLQNLYLHVNQIRNVAREAFADLEALSMVTLDLNKIAFLEEGTFSTENQTHLYEIPLDGNPFHCNCSLQWLKDYLQSIHYLEFSGATCIYPRIANFRDIDFCPEERTDQEIGQSYDADFTMGKMTEYQTSMIKNTLTNKQRHED